MDKANEILEWYENGDSYIINKTIQNKSKLKWTEIEHTDNVIILLDNKSVRST